MDKVIISTAHTGARYYKYKKDKEGTPIPVSQNLLAKRMPQSPEEIVIDAIRSYHEGSRFFHFHARDPFTGEQTHDPGVYREIFEGVKEAIPGAPVSGNTSRKGLVAEALRKNHDAYIGYYPEEVARAEAPRYNSIYGNPTHLTIFTEPDIDRRFPMHEEAADLRGNHPWWRWPEATKEYFTQLMQETYRRGIRHEVEFTHKKTFETIEALIEDKDFYLGEVGNTVHSILLFGFSNQLTIDRTAFEWAINRIGDLKKKTDLDYIVTVGAVMTPEIAATRPRKRGEPIEEGKHDYREIVEWTAEHNKNAEMYGIPKVNCIRVGVEDTPQMYGEHISTPELVREVRGLCEEYGLEVEEDINEVRKVHGMEPIEIRELVEVTEPEIQPKIIIFPRDFVQYGIKPSIMELFRRKYLDARLQK